MIIIKSGDVLQAKENLICHQCNELGVFGGGLALQIATQYPNVEKEYQEYCKDFNRKGKELYGEWQTCQAHREVFIANCFTQQNFNTRYDLVKKVFKQIKNYAKQRDLSVCMPCGYGCGIANGDWNEVLKIIESIFTDYDITIYKLKEE